MPICGGTSSAATSTSGHVRSERPQGRQGSPVLVDGRCWAALCQVRAGQISYYHHAALQMRFRRFDGCWYCQLETAAAWTQRGPAPKPRWTGGQVDRRQVIMMPGLDLALGPLLRQPGRNAHRAHPRYRRPPRTPSARPAGPADAPPAPGSPPGTPPTPARLPAPAGSRGHGTISRHSSPPLSAPACTSRSRRTSVTTASRPSIPRRGGSPWLDSPMYAVWLAP